jgi:protein tyrosine phosphatase (PTP) superfamily phosphohydrolase (DUF442 family)
MVAMRRTVQPLRWALRLVALLLLPVLGWIGWNWATANFATVAAGRVYRSGQMRAGTLARTLRETGVRTVLNLRGSHPDQAWYRAERAATLAAGATQIDLALSSCEWMSQAQARMLVRVLDSCQYPVLIHCWRGAERTGLVAAMTVLLRPGSSLAEARAQFALRYLFVRAGDGAVMLEHFERYEAWLRQQGLAHSPGQFRRWIVEGFQPGRPSREQWPYDPYPLVVITRPEPRADRLAGRNPGRIE